MGDAIDDAMALAFASYGGGGGSSGETFGPIRYEPSIGKYVQDGSRGTIRVVGGPVSQEPARDPSGYDPSTGLPYGVTRVSTTVSPTGLVYQGIPVNADGSPYTGASASQVPGYSGIKEGPGGLYGLNDKTGQYELIPGSEKLGKPATASGAATFMGGGGSYTPAKDEIGIAAAKAAGQISVAQAEAAAQQQRDAAQAALQREMLGLQQGFTGEQNALSRAFQAEQQAWQGSVTNLQLQQQDEAAKRAAANDFRSAVSDTDPIAFAALMKGWGNIENALRGGETAVTDRALGGAAGLLDLIRRPFTPIPGFTWNEPTGSFVPNATGGTGGAAVPGLTTGGSGGAASPGGAAGGGAATGGAAAGGGIPNTYNDTFANLMAQFTPRSPWELTGDVWVNRETGETERAMPGLDYNGPFNRGYSNLQPERSPYGNYGGTDLTLGGRGWASYGTQSIDPHAAGYQPPYKGYEIPGQTFNWATGQNEPAGQYGRDIAVDVAPYTPVNTPLTIPGLARGGMARGAFVVGEGSRRNPSEHSELVIAPEGAHVVPLDKPQARRLLNGGLRSYAGGTDPYAWLNDPNLVTTAKRAYGQPTYAAPPVWDEAAFYNNAAPTTTTTGGSGTTTVAAPSSPVPSSGSSVSSTTAPPVAGTTNIYGDTQQNLSGGTGGLSDGPYSDWLNGWSYTPANTTNTTNTAAVATTPTTTNTNTTPAAPAPVPTTVGGLVNYGGQQITPDYQALLDEIRNFRTDPTQNTYDRTLNPMDVSFNNLDPISQEVFYRGRQAEFGIPVLAQQWEQNRFRLPGLSRAQVGIGY